MFILNQTMLNFEEKKMFSLTNIFKRCDGVIDAMQYCCGTTWQISKIIYMYLSCQKFKKCHTNLFSCCLYISLFGINQNKWRRNELMKASKAWLQINFYPKQTVVKRKIEYDGHFVLNLIQLELVQTYGQHYVDPKYIYLKFYLFMMKGFRKINAICFKALKMKNVTTKWNYASYMYHIPWMLTLKTFNCFFMFYIVI